MTTVLFILASAAALASIFLLKRASERDALAEHNSLVCDVFLKISRIHLANAQALIRDKILTNIPSQEELDMLITRAEVSSAQARIVLAILDDIIKENNI